MLGKTPNISVAAAWFCLALTPVFLAAAEPPVRQTANVLFVTFDGLRWQEVFGGADERLLHKDFGGVRDVEALTRDFWRDDAESRRETLLPFFWREIARQGQVFGDPEQNCVARVTNGLNFSYPGYNELLAGFADERIDSNDKRPNPNVTVLEWLHRREPFRGRVAAVASWDVFPYMINAERSGIPVNAGWQPLDAAAPAELRALDELSREVPRMWENVRYDYFTFRAALDCIERDKPRVLYVSFGETDDWAHAGRYDLYLDAAQRTDSYIERLWTAMQARPQYAGKTSLVLTTDHGRGDTREDWKNHGRDVPGCDRMWIAVLGPETPARAPAGLGVTQSQVAASVAALLGEDLPRESPRSAPPLPGIVGEP